MSDFLEFLNRADTQQLIKLGAFAPGQFGEASVMGLMKIAFVAGKTAGIKELGDQICKN